MGGVLAVYVGGALSDHFQHQHPEVKPLVSGLGPLFAFPLLVISFALTDDFWVSIVTNGLAYLLSEMWLGACVAMLQSIYPAELIGIAVAIFGL